MTLLSHPQAEAEAEAVAAAAVAVEVESVSSHPQAAALTRPQAGCAALEATHVGKLLGTEKVRSLRLHLGQVSG